MYLARIFYFVKRFLPRSFQIMLRRHLVLRKRNLYTHIWPIDSRTCSPPENWVGWPHKKRFALVLTHDVEQSEGQRKCYDLIRLEEELGFRSSFNFIPERYPVSIELCDYLINNGFEVGVHGLTHDGRLYKSRKGFRERAIRINNYLKEWNAVGFRSPSMHHRLDWIHDLNITYDSSTFDTDPFEPQSDGVGTIFPIWMENESRQSGYVELPCTMPQDFTLFVLIKERSIATWKEKLHWVAKIGGMVLLNSHPDYMNFSGRRLRIDEYPAEYYEDFLKYVKTSFDDQYWNVLPKDMARFWASIYAK